MTREEKVRWEALELAMEEAEREGLIEKTGEYQLSRVSGEMVPVYRSRVYPGGSDNEPSS